MSGEDRKRPGQASPRISDVAAPSGEDDADDKASGKDNTAAERLERERRRAVRAEGRLAEIELILRQALERANGGGISAAELHSLLEDVHRRVASLEDEVRTSERELLDIVASQRRALEAMSTDREQLAHGLEQSRQELREAARSGLPDLTRRRVDFELEIDRLQSLLTQRDGLCDGLTDELEEGARIAAQVAQRLNELARGRVAPPRRSSIEETRMTALRDLLEKERADLQQMRRALDAARAELKVAQRSVVEVEEKVKGRVAPLEQHVRELHAERDRLLAEVEAVKASAALERARLEQALDRERSARVQANEAVLILEKRLADLERHLMISGEEREDELRARLAESEKAAGRSEAERIRLAERLSLLQASLAAEEADLERAVASLPEPGGSKAKVVPLMANESATRDESPAVETVIRQRQSELEKLSGRWRRLHAAYKEAVAEFDEVRAKRERLAHRFPDANAAVRGPHLTPEPPRENEATLAAEPPQDGSPVPAGDQAEPAFGEWHLKEGAPRVIVVQLDESPESVGAMRRLAVDRGHAFHAGSTVEVPAAARLVVAANLAAEQTDVLPALAELSRGGRVPRALLYGATGEKGRIFAIADVFPAPFDAGVCAAHVLRGDSQVRRVMTVGGFADMMNRLRELLGRSGCSTAVAFDRRQALDLATLVRPQYVLVDLALADGVGLDLLLELGRHTDPPVGLGVTWSRPIAGPALRAAATARLRDGIIPEAVLAKAIDSLTADS